MGAQLRLCQCTKDDPQKEWSCSQWLYTLALAFSFLGSSFLNMGSVAHTSNKGQVYPQWRQTGKVDARPVESLECWGIQTQLTSQQRLPPWPCYTVWVATVFESVKPTGFGYRYCCLWSFSLFSEVVEKALSFFLYKELLIEYDASGLS